MSASGTGPFENDFAMDLCDELRDLEGSEVLAALEEALASAADVPTGDYLDRDLAEPAVAASAIILASFLGREHVLEEADLAGSVSEIPAHFLPLVASALARTLSDDSEVYGLWIDAGRGEEWKSRVERLLNDATRATGEVIE
ncbi:DUF4259 domain-containing protein [Streptomyces sp. NPDC021096]|uniref:DUF4259 domain-containing protein n=1 Tax=Streptomyces sp. NPDC021096 TaxID=3154792 RepID=UPI0033EA4B13